MRDYLVGLGVPTEQVLVDDESFDTLQNLTNAAVLLKETGAKKVLVVTSDYHLPRAMAIAGDVGLQAVGAGSETLPEYWVKNYGRETLAWLKYWGRKYLGLKV